VRDGVQAGVQGDDVRGGGRVDLAQQRLPEVGQGGAGEPADEALEPHDPDHPAVDLQLRVVALEHPGARAVEHLAQLGDPVGVPVVVAEHVEDGHRRLRQDLGEHGGLLGLTRGREVPRDEQAVRVGGCGHGGAGRRAVERGGVDVADGGDADGSGRHRGEGYPPGATGIPPAWSTAIATSRSARSGPP
jgi:hypothetical protein